MQLPSTPGEEFFVWVKPNAHKTELLGYHQGREAFEFRIAAPPENNRANNELFVFLKNEYGLICEIISGDTSRKKRLRIQ